ncbi:hypothetical protein [Nocardia aurantiaca]|uniref:DUF8176 domain-containing protein n=1 Tax=Nocardia aurantiaca TaxID=2675850 RepID=A0A6I3KZT1_9NOCA|nr:hypothetical protein [Nocardia aurantiaca]MTE13774.1 hypothetical protein [Nocardia aurantiaca]
MTADDSASSDLSPTTPADPRPAGHESGTTRAEHDFIRLEPSAIRPESSTTRPEPTSARWEPDATRAESSTTRPEPTSASREPDATRAESSTTQPEPTSPRPEPDDTRAERNSARHKPPVSPRLSGTARAERRTGGHGSTAAGHEREPAAVERDGTRTRLESTTHGFDFAPSGGTTRLGPDAVEGGQDEADTGRLGNDGERGGAVTGRHRADSDQGGLAAGRTGSERTGADRNGSGAVGGSDDEGRDGLAKGPVRPPIPVLTPSGGEPVRVAEEAMAEAPGWASWLTEGSVAEPVGAARGPVRARDLMAEDPMAALVFEARRRAARTQRRLRIRNRALAIAGVSLALVIVAAVAWLALAPGDSQGPQAVPETTAATSTTAANQPGLVTWCQELSTPQRVSGASAGDLSSGPGVIMRLEYAWYVQRDAAAVRALLSPDARVAPEQATRDAISATPSGTQHCVTITNADPDRWNVTVDEKHPDGTQSSWQQVITTADRDGQVRITSIVAGSR